MTLIRPLAWTAITAGLTLAAGPTGLTVPALAAAQGHEHRHEHSAAGEGHGHGRGAGAGQAADIALSLEPGQPRAGEQVTLTFAFRDRAGEPFDELLTHHARQVHVVIVGEDMEVLGHVHPQDFGEPIEGGESKVFFTFPRAGRYLVAADIMTEAGPQAEQFRVEVGGEAGEARAGATATPKVAVVEAEEGDRYTAAVLLDGADRANGYQVSLARPDRIEAGEPATFTFRVARAGAPVTDLRPYLDAALHLAVVKQDFGAFLHKHGRAAGDAGQDAHGSHEHAGEAAHEPHDGHGHGHDAHGYQGPARFGPELTATFAFPEPGRYVLFGQAAHGDKLLVSRFSVEVE